jgi:phenylalanyl-tRNA synthetase beta subunit
VPLPRFPKTWQDISLRVPAEVTFEDLYVSVRKSLFDQESAALRATLEPISIYQSPDDTTHKNIALRYTVASYDKTMTDTEVAALLDHAAQAAADACGAQRL